MTEPTLKSLLRSRFRGALVGGAVGDALGFPYEGCSRSYMLALGEELTRRYEKHRTGYFPPGQYSDDTQMTLATVEAILAQGEFDGAAIAAHFVPLWRENRIVGRGRATTESIERLISGAADWQSSGSEEGRAGNGAAMRAAPYGLWHYDDIDLLIENTKAASGITHTDGRAVAGAVAVAAAVAYNLTHREVILGEFLDFTRGAASGVSEDFCQHLDQLPRLLSVPEESALAEIATLGLSGPYRECGEGIPPFVVPSVLIAFYYFLRAPHDFDATVGGCLRAGGDVDTTGAISGAISGSFNGDDAVPGNLVEGVPDVSALLKLADRFHELKAGGRRR